MRNVRLAATLLAATAVGGWIAPAPAVALDVEPTETKMMLVLDASGSMAEKTSDGTKRIDAAKDALRRVINKIPEGQQVGLRVYGATVFDRSEEGACTDSQLVVAPGGSKDELTAALDDYKPYGETPIGYALQEAGKDLGNDGQRTIVLVSDGEPNCDPDPCDVAKDLSKNGINVRVDVVGLDVSGKARDKLRCIAKNGNGTYYDVDTADELVRSIDVSTTRASRPFDLTGTPVEGTAAAKDAPTVSTGLWLDEFADNGSDLWYRVDRTITGSTIHAGIAHRSSDIGNFGEKVNIEIYADPTKARCRSESSFARGSLGYAGVSSAKENPDVKCNTADHVFIKVKPLQSHRDKLAGDPLELAIYEEPPLKDPASGTSAGLDKPEWIDLEPGVADDTVVPGTAVSNAPVVTDGTYAFDINPGETQVVAVPLDWGQNLQAQLDGQATRQDLFDYESPNIQITGPLRHEVGGDYTDTALSEDWTPYNGLPVDVESDYRWGRQAFTVAYRNRFAIEDWWAGSSLPGLRYVLVSLPEDAAEPMPYTLTIKTNGTAGEGAPEYMSDTGLQIPTADSDLVTAEAVTEAIDTDETTDAADAEGSPTDNSGTPWVPIGLSAAGVIALAGAALAVKRGRSSQGEGGSDQ